MVLQDLALRNQAIRSAKLGMDAFAPFSRIQDLARACSVCEPRAVAIVTLCNAGGFGSKPSDCSTTSKYRASQSLRSASGISHAHALTLAQFHPLWSGFGEGRAHRLAQAHHLPYWQGEQSPSIREPIGPHKDERPQSPKECGTETLQCHQETSQN